MTDHSGHPTKITDQAKKEIAQSTETADTDSHQIDDQQIEAHQKSLSESEQPGNPHAGSGGWGWGFNVNAVAGNIGGLFGAGTENHDSDKNGGDSDREDGDAHSDVEAENELGTTAANIASAATAELEIASKAAQETIGKAAEEIGKGWGTFNSFLDDMLASKPGADSTSSDDGNIHSQFQSVFPKLAEEDEVVDHFRCALLQKYRCYLNNSTPEKTYVLRGILFVSTAHVAMYVTDDGGQFGGEPFSISIPLKSVGKIQKGAKAMLKLVTKEPITYSYIFAEFESDSHFSSALSLLEHMTAASTAQPPSSTADTTGGDESSATT
eukprot:GFKZ01009602.1.p1 GENE.GFKZ01009602.1~~GFKZ01009602.1.p1  ORF type:complete len:325 (-),score=56.39 GFKZ01009602.1:1036-2010(-)